MSDAPDADADSQGVVRREMSAALRRRASWVGHALLGGRSVAAALFLWLALVIVTVLTFLFGGVFGAALLGYLAVAAVGLTFAGQPSRPTSWLLGGSAVVGIGAGGYVWWVLGAQIDAADTFTSPPAAAAYGGIGLVVLGPSIAVFVASAGAAYVRRPH